MQDYRLEDQGEWERCRSSRRMFLALIDAGKERDLRAIARGLLRLIEQQLPRAEETEEARFFWENGLTDPDHRKKGRPKELADRVYLVMRCAAEVLDKNKRVAPYGGDLVICRLIRQTIPLAPGGFRKVGKREGGPALPSDSERRSPHKTTFKNVGRSAPETVGEVF